MQRLCVFCGSNVGNRPVYAQMARELGAEIARRELELVYGGGRVGLMGIVADSAMAAGARVTGIITEQLLARETGHTGIHDLQVVATMHQRKAAMAAMADAFLALPGGFGTFEELCEMITWAQLRIHAKPCAVLNVEGYFDPLLAQFDRALADQLLKPQHRGLIVEAPTPAEALDAIASWVAPTVDKWYEAPKP